MSDVTDAPDESTDKDFGSDLINDDLEIKENDDGSATVRVTSPRDDGEQEFYSNLADSLPPDVLNLLATELLQEIEYDKEARKKRDQQYEEGLRRTGLGQDAPGGADFPGASKVVHPMMVESCIDFASHAIKEAMPPGGPVKEYIPGGITPDKLAKAKRKVQHMNWQLTVQIPEFRHELEQVLTQTPLAGAAYFKVYYDHEIGRIRPIFIPIDEMLLPYSASSFYTAHRKTHMQTLNRFEFERRIDSGMYRDVSVFEGGMTPDQTAAGKANDKIEGRDQSSFNEDGMRTVYECYVYRQFPDDDGEEGEYAPYIVSIDDTSRAILSIYRNWEERDEYRKELEWIVELPMIPWRGAYPIGMTHIIAGLSAAATGALRALLDSAHIANNPTTIRLKGVNGQTLNLRAAQDNEIEADPMMDDVRKIAMPLPFPGPSSTLFQLLGFLTDSARAVVRTAMDDTSDQNTNVPVGTTMARIEQGMTVFSAIHGRICMAMGRVLRIVQRLNYLHLDEQELKVQAGEVLAGRDDYANVDDVIPVSDPEIFMEAQRYARVQAVAQRAAAAPQLYDLRKVEEMILGQLKVANGNDLLLPKPEAHEMNPVNENLAMTLSRPVIAFPEQDHLAHLQTHVDYARTFMTVPNMAPAIVGPMLTHLKEHIGMLYARLMFDYASQHADIDISKFIDKDPATSQAFDRMMATASTAVMPDLQRSLQNILPQIQALSTVAQQYQQPPPMDPSHVAMMDVQRKQQADSSDNNIRMLDMRRRQDIDAQRAKNAQDENARLAQKDAADTESRNQAINAETLRTATEQENANRRVAAQNAAKIAMNNQDNQTAVQLSLFEGATGHKTSLTNGTGMNPRPS